MPRNDPLAERAKQWGNTDVPPKRGRGEFTPLPDGKYQAEIASGTLTKVKKGKLANTPRVSVQFRVITGEHKGKSCFNGINLDQPASKGTKNGREWSMPSGFGQLRQFLDTIGLMDELDARGFSTPSLKKTLGDAVGTKVEIAVRNNNGFTNVYLNNLLDTETALDEDVLEETAQPDFEEDAESTDTAASVSDEPASPPKTRRRRSKTSADNPPQPSTPTTSAAVPEEDDFELFDTGDVSDWDLED